MPIRRFLLCPWRSGSVKFSLTPYSFGVRPRFHHKRKIRAKRCFKLASKLWLYIFCPGWVNTRGISTWTHIRVCDGALSITHSEPLHWFAIRLVAKNAKRRSNVEALPSGVRIIEHHTVLNVRWLHVDVLLSITNNIYVLKSPCG